jgi:hypothetical protein
MLLNKHNLNIAALCSKEESRFTLKAILVTPEASVETDGHQLIKVTLPNLKVESFPDIANKPKPVDTWKPFLLPASEALNIVKALPKKSSIPVLKCAAVTEATDQNGHASILVTDLEMTREFNPKKPEGNFPDYERVMPKDEEVEYRTAFNPELLGRVLKQVQDFISEDKTVRRGIRHFNGCILSFTKPNGALRIEAKNDEGQTMTAVVMPMRDDYAEPEIYRRRKAAEKLISEFLEDYQQPFGQRISRKDFYAKIQEALAPPEKKAPDKKEDPEPEPDEPEEMPEAAEAEPETEVRCSNCGIEGHTAETCSLKLDQIIAAHEASNQPPEEIEIHPEAPAPPRPKFENAFRSAPTPIRAGSVERPADWDSMTAGKKAAWTRKHGRPSAA